MRRRLFLALSWLVATAGATLVAWQAVALVGQQVTGREVAAPATVPTSVASSTGSTDSTAPAATATSSPPPGTDPAASTPGPTVPYTLTGGSVGLRCLGTGIELQWATPAGGFAVTVHHGGPDEVDVRFESEGHESRINATCATGQVSAEIREDD